MIDVRIGRDMQQRWPPIFVAVRQPIVNGLVEHRSGAQVRHERDEEQEQEKEHWRVAQESMKVNFNDIELIPKIDTLSLSLTWLNFHSNLRIERPHKAPCHQQTAHDEESIDS